MLPNPVDLAGCKLAASDRDLGHVKNFCVDDRSRALRALIVDAGHGYSGQEILLAPAKVGRISHEYSKIFVNLTKAEIERTAQHRLARTGEGKHSKADFSTSSAAPAVPAPPALDLVSCKRPFVSTAVSRRSASALS